MDWTLADAQACADIMEAKRRLGEPLDDHLPDAMTAAAAVTRGLTVLTQNEAEFRNTGAAWVNPWTGLTGLVRQVLTGTRISMGQAADSPGPQRLGQGFLGGAGARGTGRRSGTGGVQHGSGFSVHQPGVHKARP